MNDRRGVLMPLGAMLAAFLAVLVLGSAYNVVQPEVQPQAEPVPQPGPTTVAVTQAPPAPAPTTPNAPATAVPSGRDGQAAPDQSPAGPRVVMHLDGNRGLVDEVFNAGLTVTVNQLTPSRVDNDQALPVAVDQLERLCLATPTTVKFRLANGKRPESDNCFHAPFDARDGRVTVVAS